MGEASFEIDILQLYWNQDKTAFISALHQIAGMPDVSVPLIELFSILEEEMDPRLNREIVFACSSRITLLRDNLYAIAHNHESEIYKLNALTIIAAAQDIRDFQFFLEYYMKHRQFRSFILDTVFPDRSLLLMNLALWFQDQVTGAECREEVIELLKLIKTEVYYQNAAQLRFMKISDLFYSIDPDEIGR